MTGFFDRISSDARTAIFALMAAISLPSWASAGSVTVTAGFNQYSGAVGNGTGIAPDVIYESVMNDNYIAPIQPLPGSESLFIAPDPDDPSSVGQGIGLGVVPLGGATSVFFYTDSRDSLGFLTSVGIANLLSFTPGPAVDVGVGTPFLLGTFTVQNGEWWAASPVHEFTFEMVTHSSDPLLDGHTFSDTIIWYVTPNGGPPDVKADYFYFAGHPELGSVRVLEASDGDNRGTVDFYGQIGSLDPTGFANPTGGVFLDPSVDPFPIPPPPTVVPEPSAFVAWSFMIGVVGAVWTFRRQSRPNLGNGALT
jgi:hypothetical protein